MGQQVSVEVSEDIPLPEAIDKISAHYITTQTAEDMELFTQEEFCSTVMKLLSDIFLKRIHDLDSQLVLQRIKKGSKALDLAELTPRTFEGHDSERAHLDIADFYVRIAHLYSVVARALNMSNLLDITQKARGMRSHSEPSRLENIKSLVDTQLRNVHLAKEIYGLEEKMQQRKEELPNLEPLYFDVYDPSAQLYTGMSKKAKRRFEEDIKGFYKGFTQEDIPSGISGYSDISLSKSCKSDKDDDTPLFEEYGQRMGDVVVGARKARDELLGIINSLMLEEEGVKTVHPELTTDKLNELIERSREVIVEKYMENESDYLAGMETLEAVVERLLGDTMRNQLSGLNSQLLVLISQ